MKSKISSFFEKNVGKLALSGIVFALALVVALTTVFVLNGKKLENKTTPPTNAETTIVPNNLDNWIKAGNYDAVNISTGEGFSGGDGSEADPYIISTARQLAGLSYLASTGGATTHKCYKLGGDINLLDHYWTPIGTDRSNYFNGSFDGNGYVISGMVIDINSSSFVYAGLFGYMKAGTDETHNISNLGIENSEINVISSFPAYAGGLVGGSWSSLTITNSYNTVDVRLNSAGESYAGGLVGATYKSLTIESSYNTGDVSVASFYSPYSGGLVGYSSSTLTITNSYNSGNVSANSTSSSAFAGGLMGYSSSLKIENSYNTGDVSATSSSSSSSAYAGGFTGEAYSSSLTITNSFNTGAVEASGSTIYKGGLVGRITSSGTKTINNSYFDGDVFSGKMVGNGTATITASGKVSGLSALMKDKNNYGTKSFGTYTDDNYNPSTGPAVWSSESPWNFESVWGEDVFGTNNGYPVLRTKEYNDMLPLLDKHWKYNAATSYAGGDGTQSSPYLISSAEELALLSNDVNSGKFYDQETGTDKYIYAQLTDDIDLSGKYWNPIGQLNIMGDGSGYNFVGSFDGNGYEIMNLEFDFNSLIGFVGVFGFVGKMDGQVNEKYNEIKNLGVSGNDIELIFPSSSQNHGMGLAIAGIVSYAIHTKIEDCYNKANITVDGAEGTVAGIVGAMSGEVKNCYNTGNLTMNIDIGDVSRSYSANVGGVVGGGGLPSVNIDLISNCYNSGKLSAETFGYCMGFNISIGGISVSWAGEIKNSYNIGDIYGQSNANETTSSSLSLGGINAFVGSDLDLAIYNSFNTGKITGSYSGGTNLPENSMRNMNAKGGILGWKTSSSNLIITNSYFDSSKFSGNLTGKVDREDDGTDVYEVINSGKVSGLSEKMRDKANYGVSSFGTYTDDSSSTGSAIWSSENPWDFAEVWMIEQGFNFEYPIFKTMKAKMWKYSAATGFAGGLGTAESPYQISSAEELAYLSNLANQGNTMTHKYYELTADIDLSGKYWTPIGLSYPNYFVGSFDGNGYVISAMTIDMKSSTRIYSGLFGEVRRESDKIVNISNLGIKNCEIKGDSAKEVYAGGLVGFSYSPLTITNSYNTGGININGTSYGAYAGGLVGSFNDSVEITNSYNTGNVSATSSSSKASAGGMVGRNGYRFSLIITSSYNTGKVSATSSSYAFAGGLVGEDNSSLTISNCYNAGGINAIASEPEGGFVPPEIYMQSGGLVGRVNQVDIDQCFNSGKVSTNNSSANVGGIAGTIDGTATINNTFCTGDIQSPSGSEDYIKPLFGSGTASITNSYHKLDMLDSSGGVASTQENYYDKGSSDSVAFDGNIWFYHADLNEGLPLLRSLFWAESTVAVQSDVYNNITNKIDGAAPGGAESGGTASDK